MREAGTVDVSGRTKNMGVRGQKSPSTHAAGGKRSCERAHEEKGPIGEGAACVWRVTGV